MSKLFPIVSVWETRAAEPVAEKIEAAVPRALARPYVPPALGMVLIACVLGASVSARAADTPPATHAAKTPKPTTLSLQWEALPVPPARRSSQQQTDVKPGQIKRVYLSTVQLLVPVLWFGSKDGSVAKQQPPHPMSIMANLRDSAGKPISYQPVGFSLKTNFGTWLQFGKTATDETGNAKLVLRDRRCGIFPFQATYAGDDANAISYAEGKVDFGACPPPALPSAGVLITPYWTAGIALPFVLFYGIMWGTFVYAFGYLVFWRMRRAAPKIPVGYRTGI